MNKQQLIKQITELIENFKETTLEFQEHNFRVNSDGWKKITVDGKSYLENDKKDIWEFLDENKGEQLFTWDSAIRETKKAGLRMPTDDEFTELLKTKSDMPNVIFTGFRGTGGSFYFGGTSSYFWSSVGSGGSAWERYLNSGNAGVNRNTDAVAYGFSVRCLKD
jgi:hypothetical protein